MTDENDNESEEHDGIATDNYTVAIVLEKTLIEVSEEEAIRRARELGDAIEALTPFQIDFCGDVEVEEE